MLFLYAYLLFGLSVGESTADLKEYSVSESTTDKDTDQDSEDGLHLKRRVSFKSLIDTF